MVERIMLFVISLKYVTFTFSNSVIKLQKRESLQSLAGGRPDCLRFLRSPKNGLLRHSALRFNAPHSASRFSL